ncbi:MAG: homocysteine S-methyltransferase family protein [Eggerthellaceae bacterium]|nr:homocysteine S-methyltransferase family protein [Eggerthellaceae bacterium]
MPDIQLRFHKDMLVLTAPVDATLERQGFDVVHDKQYLNLMEPDSVRDALRMELAAGAQCLVTPTEDITSARLAHVRMEHDAPRLAESVCEFVAELKPQHVLVEIGPCGLPLDPSSKASLNESKSQYAQAARLFADKEFDAFFLNGFTSIDDLRCALMGVAQVSGKPIFASVRVIGSGILAKSPSSSNPDELSDAIALMADMGVSVVGFETSEPLDNAIAYAKIACACTDLPVLAQLRVMKRDPKQGGPTATNPYYCPDTMEQAAVKLYGCGVQFLRATGAATPAYTGALAATMLGVDVRTSGDGGDEGESSQVQPQGEPAARIDVEDISKVLGEIVAGAFSRADSQEENRD